MRFLFCLVLAATLSAQSESVTYGRDVNGRRVALFESSTGQGARSERVVNLNGRAVPLETVEEKVLEKDGNRTVVERLVRRHDPNGTPLPPERIVVAETKRPDGVTETSTAVYRPDVNGRLTLSERETIQSRKEGEREISQSRLEKPVVNGSFQVVERRDRNGEVESVFRPDSNGRFFEASRQVTKDRKESGAEIREVTEYQTTITGKLEVSRQSVSRTETTPSGEKRQIVDVYGPAAPGRAAETQLQLRERQIIERTPTPTGAVETYSIQRPSLSSTKELGPVTKISETVCKGKC